MKTILLTLVLILAAVTLVASDDPRPDAPAAPAKPVLADSPERPPRTVALDPEIRGLLEQQDAALADLYVRFRAAGTQEDAMEVQRLIRQVKIDTEIAIMESQHRRLLAAGRTEEARSVAATLRALRNPDEIRAAAAHPEERPAPSAR